MKEELVPGPLSPSYGTVWQEEHDVSLRCPTCDELLPTHFRKADGPFAVEHLENMDHVVRSG